VTSGAEASASQQAVRRHNRNLVLRAIAAEPRRSRAQLAEHTGLTKATVSSVADELIGAGLVAELDADRGARGRPAVPLVLNPDGPSGLGIEVNVDYVSACVVDLTGTVRGYAAVGSDNRTLTPGRVLRRATDLAARVVAQSGLPVAGAVIAVPGLVDTGGTVRRVPNLPGWDGLDCARRVRARFGVATRVENEANAAAVAELRSRPELADFLLVSGEIGVGAGLVLSGRPFRGPRGFSGELGHVPVDPAGPECGCGACGCLEQYVGQEALLNAAGLPGVASTQIGAPGGAAGALLAAAARGDQRTLGALADAGRTLGVTLAGVLNVLDVPTVVLGGLYARLAPWLQGPIGEELQRRTITRAIAPASVIASALGPDSAVIGAAVSVIDEVLSDALPPAGADSRQAGA
jgi:predicted NBD/HSP70 family sugar kinase